MRILLVEDDAMIGRAMLAGLLDAGFSVDWVADGNAAEVSLAGGDYDLTVLDLGLPRQDGMSLLKALRGRSDSTPVLIATARDSVVHRIAALNEGADDYIVKPFDIDELVARMRAVLRRCAAAASSVRICGQLRLDTVSKRVSWQGELVALSAREFALLEVLMQRPGAVLSRKKLEESIYNWNDDLGSNAVEVHIHRLRRKLGVEVIRNVRGVGYCVQGD
ncbi:response regulator [Variovorax sp. RT4R15]|uniref:response regulator n=1 Tax=Variovorax sp. RT4R15 TaxID=3443737 RepID=UPI003F454E4F